MLKTPVFAVSSTGHLAPSRSVLSGISVASGKSGTAKNLSAAYFAQNLNLHCGMRFGVMDADPHRPTGEWWSPVGGMCVSHVVHQQIRDRLNLTFHDMGPQQLKKIDRDVHAWRWAPQDGQKKPVSLVEDGFVLPEKPSIAVLPFENMSRDVDQEYFADGIAEDILTTLSRIEWFFVTARNSSFGYKGRAIDIPQIGRELGVRCILEGSARSSGNRLRVTAQLIDATTGSHVWAERYDREMNDIFDVQDEINPNCSIAYGAMATCQNFASFPDQAIVNNEIAIRSNPRDPTLFNRNTGMGISHYLIGRLEKAID